MIRTHLATLLAVALTAAPTALTDTGATPTQAARDTRVATARRLLRVIYCERCPGKDYEGLSAPSLVDHVKTQGREMFLHKVLDGDPPRGMPAYRDNPLVAENIGDIYDCLLGRAVQAADAAAQAR